MSCHLFQASNFDDQGIVDALLTLGPGLKETYVEDLVEDGGAVDPAALLRQQAELADRWKWPAVVSFALHLASMRKKMAVASSSLQIMSEKFLKAYANPKLCKKGDSGQLVPV